MRGATKSGLLAACMAAAACVTTPAARTADPAGCWYFARDDAAAALNLPWGIRLTADELTGFAGLAQRGDARVARTLDPASERDHPFGYWMPIGADSIEVGYPAGGGLVLRLARGDSSMAGSARPVGDVVRPGAPPRTTHAVRLTSAQCPTY